ncbi:MAG TPA: class I SAM-dependent methyltransferase [Flavisolibacter sp.]
MKRYYFEDVDNCEMCGDETSGHKVLGQRLSQSTGHFPRRKTGITVSVKRCNRCGLVYAAPLPIPFDMQDHYGIPPDSYWRPEYFRTDDDYFLGEIREAKPLLNFQPGMTALDVGAGLGKAMITLDREGFSAFGLEPSRPFYEKAISEMGISTTRLRMGAIEELDYQPESFDFITFGAVFEHLYHPAQSLATTLKWLKPGGIIHIEVPSGNWLIGRLINLFYRLQGTNYVTNLSPMHVPFHLYEFSLDSFREAGRRLGFSVVSHRFEVCDLSPLPSWMHPVFRKIMKATDTGMQLTVYIKKSAQ